MKTKLFTTENELKTFLTDVNYQTGWNQKENFLNTISIKSINFQTHNLLIYRMTETSSSIVLAVDVLTELKNHITIQMSKDKSETMTMDMAYYALAYIVDKKVIDIRFNDGENNRTGVHLSIY